MLYERQYLDESNNWETLTEQQLLEHLEGYYKDPKAVLSFLEATPAIPRKLTPCAMYRCKSNLEER